MSALGFRTCIVIPDEPRPRCLLHPPLIPRSATSPCDAGRLEGAIAAAYGRALAPARERAIQGIVLLPPESRSFVLQTLVLSFIVNNQNGLLGGYVVKNILARMLNPHGRLSFFFRQKAGCTILDIGCGNDSPFRTKQILPDCCYTGIDIADYNLTKPNLADNYILTSPENFADEIAKLAGQFDAVISAHNLEHCDDQKRTIRAMAAALKPGGMLYLAFPSERSVRLPRRGGCLNYYDDTSHKGPPPNVDVVVGELTNAGLTVNICSNPYQPLLYRLIGLIVELLSRIKNRVMPGTWALYGFETVIWAARPRDPVGSR
jgi:SAM-dependent methyltransferase